MLGLAVVVYEQKTTTEPASIPSLRRADAGTYTPVRLGTLSGRPGFTSNAFAINPAGVVER
jgi:hypothetical protein